jgi:hypothetical protein
MTRETRRSRIAFYAVTLSVTLAACQNTVDSAFSLSKEQMRSTSSSVGTTSGCTTGRDGAFTYLVAGKSAGPYLGSFHASGQVTLKHGVIESFSEQFKILAGKIRILGHAVSIMPGGTGFCIPDTGLTNVLFKYSVTATLADGSHRQASGSARATVLGGQSGPSQLFQEFSN